MSVDIRVEENVGIVSVNFFLEIRKRIRNKFVRFLTYSSSKKRERECRRAEFVDESRFRKGKYKFNVPHDVQPNGGDFKQQVDRCIILAERDNQSQRIDTNQKKKKKKKKKKCRPFFSHLEQRTACMKNANP